MKDDDASSIEPSDGAHISDVKIPQSISGFPTKNRKSSHASDASSSAEPHAIQEPVLGIPKEWRDVPFDDLREEGWKPRKRKKKNGKEYMTLRLSWTGQDGKTQNKERGFGVYDADKYALLLELMNPENEGDEEDFPRDGVSPHDPEGVPKNDEDEYGTMEASGITPDRLPDARRYAIRGARILQSGVGRHISIPDKFYFDTDILEFYEYFKSKGFSGTIVEWMHECVRNYLMMRHYKVGVIFERGVNT